MPRRRRRFSGLRTLALSAGLLTTLAACESFDFGKDTPGPSPAPAIGEGTEKILEAVDTAIAQRRIDDAAILLGRILKKDPNNAQAKLRVAEMYLLSNKLLLAAAAFKHLSTMSDVRAKALQGIGIAMMKQGDLDAAHKALKEAVDADASLWRAWNALGVYYDTQSLWNEADQSYKRALAAKPELALIHNNLGRSLLMQRKFPDATSAFRKALRIRPDLQAARANLRLSLAWEGKYQEATAGVKRGDLPMVLNDVGYIATLRGDYEQAEALLSRAMVESPSFYETASKNLDYVKSIRGTKK
ncbi:MAG: tetratricopeptide repeat protein [Proteobacteria bacterium]|nr:tetratricopeptide repeat protein [Pseudomonadota bacterium]